MHYRRGDGRWVKRLVDPYGLVAKASVWYLVGSSNNWSPQVYRVSRIQDAHLSDGRFQRPPTFHLATFWQQWSNQFEARQTAVPVQVCVHEHGMVLVAQLFGEWIFDQLKTPEHATQVGDALLTLTFDSLDSACRRLLALGTAVTVLHPPELREKMRETAVKLAATYAINR
jgi:predicted DNA-binding transcriptional regulator YafY